MMKYLIGIGALILIGGGVWWYAQPTATTLPSMGSSAVVLPPGATTWVEVLTPTVTVVASDGATTTLRTGDEVGVGSTITTNTAGVVLIHFPDGSFAKLDPQSSLTLTTIGYDESNGSLTVHVTLGKGTLWSKVLDLVGLNSSWQVETSNTVATVRGTSFMTSKVNGKTKVVGIEHKVTVAPLTSGTHTPLAETEVTTDTEVTIDDSHIGALTSGKERLSTTTISKTLRESEAFKAFKAREKQFDDLRDSLRTQFTNEVEFRKAFRDAQVETFKETILEIRTELLQAEQRTTTTETTPAIQKETTTNTTKTETTRTTAATTPVPSTASGTATSGGGSPTTAAVRPTGLSLTTESDLGRGVSEGDRILFHAILLFSDGTKKDVTTTVKWNVINKAGTFPAPGNFVAELPLDYAELGEVSGAVYATYIGTDGKELNAASKAFMVHAYIPPVNGTDG
jgi:hypothetical protein